jgi:V/A-type H+/Na+-transporting ATPase subunit E
MGQEQLIEELRRIGEESAEAVRREADAEIEQLRSEAAARLESVRGDAAEHRASACAEETRTILAGAAGRSRLIRIAAENALAERLHEEARRSLRSLRNRDYEKLFVLLATELPPLRWEKIRVNPADLDLAGHQFPDAEIVADAAIAGGLEASCYGKQVRVDNTLEKRLERAWPELLPSLIRTFTKE